ncbi:restriction endonuclease subunit S [Burkholderia cenocepacia]|uniref:restriction endonuclease subunit S n=1 Tax=Burkholderia cenocepacia TaxID=95486 RepID=UPI001F1D4E72|nr:restriction endonuclease subunit S [Burkholderia cenocepacia]MCF1365073.1 restriction endonuclease subunit S [Burkholderia cenocepacia]MCF1382608.1 restriction endonuclease subunit S [Burkholderia cenocepacia]
MAREQVEKPLGDIYDFRSGLSKAASEFGSGYPFLTFKDVFYNAFVPDELGDLVNSTEAERSACDIKRGDVFLTRTSETMDELGMSCVALRDVPFATFNGFTKRLRPKPGAEIVPEYAGYFFRGPQFRRNVTAMSSLSTRASLNNDMLARLRMSLPSMAVQASIGDTLKSLDNKIGHNRKTGRLLEQLARAIYRAWFVDFEPVKAKVAGASYFCTMPQRIFDDLPSCLIDSEIGPIPQGWVTKPLSSVCTLVSGGTPKRSEPSYWHGDVPWYSVKDAPDNGDVWVIRTSEQITEDGVTNSAARIVPKGCTIISARGTVGKLAMAGTSMAFNQSCYGLLPIDGASFSHLYLLMQTVVADLQRRTHGSVFDTITRSTFDGLMVVSPPSDVVSSFEGVVSPLFALSLSLREESTRLAEIRDYLLPRLLGGSVYVEANDD